MASAKASRWVRRLSLLPALVLITGAFTPGASATGSKDDTKKGSFEICKQAEGDGVAGDFKFTVSGLSDTFTVPAGQCSFPIKVDRGNVTVTELASADYQLSAVSTVPKDALVSEDLAARTATVTVSGSGKHETIVTFTNKRVPVGYLEVCKKAKAAGGQTLAGMFNFQVSAGGTVRTVTAPVDGCSGPVSLPLGTATITEETRSDARLVHIGVYPKARVVGSPDVSRAKVSVQIVTGGIAAETIVTFTNKPVVVKKGIVKVCKLATVGVPKGTPFTFLVDSAKVTVQAGYCSLPQVAAGTAVVTEEAKSGYVVTDIKVTPRKALLSYSLEDRTASVKVMANGVTEVLFTNKKAKGVLKVCKAAFKDATNTEKFTFDVAGKQLTAQAGYCSLPLKLDVGTYTLSENVPNGYKVKSIDSPNPDALLSTDLAAGSAVVAIGSGTTEIIFTNKKTAKTHK